MRRILLFMFIALNIFFILLSGSYSSEWLQVETPMYGEQYYVDLGSITSKGHVVTFWVKNIDRRGEAIKTRFSIDCEKGIGAIRDIIIYGRGDTVLKSYSYKDKNLQWGRIAPDSFMSGFQKLLCKDKRIRDLSDKK